MSLSILIDWLKQLVPNIDDEDKILIQIDSSNTNQKVEDVIRKHSMKLSNSQFEKIYFSLDKNFANFKNNLTRYAKKDGYIFQLDADEYISYDLMLNLKWFLAKNPKYDLLKVFRINVFSEFNKNDPSLDEFGRSDYPCYQWRIYKPSNPNIKWVRPLHEKLVGANTKGRMPANDKFNLIHLKTYKKQDIAVKLYQEIEKLNIKQ
ncbi:hypothetical protein NOVO_00195 [Rickettsiales bacterium Ac37b]|nr:hypothetical protein NOVO_00195 [Rickettsiales bacterium Ac37b]